VTTSVGIGPRSEGGFGLTIALAISMLAARAGRRTGDAAQSTN
jgi:hypothetical protein